MDFAEPDSETPLLFNTASPGDPPTPNYHGAFLAHPSAKVTQADGLDSQHSLEDHVLPETAVPGRTLGWSSAYILTLSRVVGSGIFATPGSIVSSVGSIGLSLLLWVAGALISWCGLVVSLEYGCMLPRSGGQ
jgi:hypothetical protein